MEIKINEKILEKWPNTRIAFIIADVKIQKKDEYVENLKTLLLPFLKEENFTKENIATCKIIHGWQTIYKEQGASNYTCSLEALITRLINGRSLLNIWNIVDLYNCCSVLKMCPIRAYDLDKITGDTELRFGKIGENLNLFGMKKCKIENTNNVVYADNKNILSWLWNYRDSQ